MAWTRRGMGSLRRNSRNNLKIFVLLDSVAIEACQTLNIPLGKEVGTIELAEMGGLTLPLFKWMYYTEA